MASVFYTNDCSGECNLLTFYERFQSIDPLLIKKYSYQGLEVFALIKSLNLTVRMLESLCNNGNTEVQNSTYKLIVDSNQMLAIGYSHIVLGFPLILSIYPNVELVIRNGGKLVIFNDNSLINYGNIYLDNSAIILESNNIARLINNGCITLKSSFLVGKGIIFNNGKLNAICYSKISLGKNKANGENGEDDDVVKMGENGESDRENGNIQKALTTLDFTENYSRLINAGYFELKSYSSIDIDGSLVNGKNELTSCFIDQLSDVVSAEFNYDPLALSPKNAIFKVSGNSKLNFTFGDNIETELLNDRESIFTFDNNTQSVFKVISNSNSRNTLINKGVITLNGEATFKNINVENYNLIQTTYSVDEADSNIFRFNYARVLFTSSLKTDPPKISNISKESSIRIAPTCTLFVDGYNIVNYGTIINGHKVNSDVDCIIGNEDRLKFLFCANNLSLSATFVYGYISPNPSAPRIVFKNFNHVYVSPKSIFMMGKNSTLSNNGKQQVCMLNQGLIYNYGLLQVNRSSIILNRPDPFSIHNEEYSIINGGEPNFQSNAVILIRKPLKTVADGGFIKSISALLYTGGKIQNNGNAVIIFWVSYESEEVIICDKLTVKNTLIKGLQSAVVGTGQLRRVPFPALLEWDQPILQDFLQEQAKAISDTNGVEYSF